MNGVVGLVDGALGMKEGRKDRPVRSSILSCTFKRRRSWHVACPYLLERGSPWSAIARPHSQFPPVSANIPALSRQITIPNPDLLTKSRDNNHCCHKESGVMSTSFTPPSPTITFRYLNAITGKIPQYILRCMLEIYLCLVKTITNRLDTQQCTTVRRLDP